MVKSIAQPARSTIAATAAARRAAAHPAANGTANGNGNGSPAGNGHARPRSRRLPRIDPAAPLTTPFTIVYDQREQAPYSFANLRSNADKLYRPLAVQLLKGHLVTGDYSILGHESEIAVERKSLEDAYSSVAARVNFEAEHQRMAEIIAAGGRCYVIIEASVRDALLHPPEWSRLSPVSFDRTRVSWMDKYGVPWLFEDGRRRAEVTAFRILETWWWHRAREWERVIKELF